MKLRRFICLFSRSIATTADASKIITESPVLRDYQEECIRVCLEEYQRGIRRQVVSLPVGACVIMANMIPRIPSPTETAQKTLILAHRKELLDQASQQILRFNPTWRVTIDQGRRKADIENSDVVVASIQTLSRADSGRLERYDPNLFKCVIIDEVHHAAAKTYIKVMTHFQEHQSILLWGCSATVVRHDGLGLYQSFEKITYEKKLIEMMKNNWLCPLRVISIESKLDLSKVRLRLNDFCHTDLAGVVNTEERNRAVVASWQTYAEPTRRSTVVFAVDIAHTLTLCNRFRENGIDAEYITGKTPTHLRAEILERFRNREFPVLVNCGILTEGTDIPGIDCVLMARPTKSHGLYQQMLGRGLRLHPGKDDCLLIEFTDKQSRGHKQGLACNASLLGLDPKIEEIGSDSEVPNQISANSHRPLPDESNSDKEASSATDLLQGGQGNTSEDFYGEDFLILFQSNADWNEADLEDELGGGCDSREKEMQISTTT
ncbi:P-loop containing nucleoside triphosphate hydrolase protein [Dichotomocladium elegans]|nr:P-loop containing nucleoside triphosphate hydrolase protein [Dichotomocladium elegans]